MTNLKLLKENILTENFFRPKWYSVFINPYFINRNSLYTTIRDFAKNTPSEAKILDVGCGIKPYRSLFVSNSYTGIDIAGGGHVDDAKTVDAYYDGYTIPYSDASFDTLICTQVLEHADDPEILVKECARVLKTGGRAFFSMPFVYPEHEIPYDFRRFTRFEHQRLFEKNNFSEIKITQTTGIFGTFGQLFVVWIFEGIPFRAPLLKAVLSFFIFAPIQIIALFLDWVTGKSGPTMDYVITVQK